MRAADRRFADEHTEMVAPAWTRFVTAHPHGDLLQTDSWAAAKAVMGQSSLVSTVRRNGAIVGGALILTKPIAPLALGGYVARGPLVAVDDPVLATETVDQMLADARRARIRFLIVSPAVDGVISEELRRRSFAEGAPPPAVTASLHLDLTRPVDDLLAGMSRSRRRAVRRAERTAVTFAEETDVDLFHRLHTSTARRQGFAATPLPFLRAQWDELRPVNQVALLVARVGGIPAAALWLTPFNGIAAGRYSGWDPEVAPDVPVNDALEWYAIRWAKDAGHHTYDFGGLDRKVAERVIAGEELSEGFTRTTGFFKLGFGGRPVLYGLPVLGFTHRLVHAALTPGAARYLGSKRGRRSLTRVRAQRD